LIIRAASNPRPDFLGDEGQATEAAPLKYLEFPPMIVRRKLVLSEGWIFHMDVPSNLDTFLKDMLAEEEATVQLDAEDRAFVDRILKSITTGSKGIFVVLHPNDRMQYMLLNTNRAGAIALLARVMQRTAEALEADLD
jgi:hypothetical protein